MALIKLITSITPGIYIALGMGVVGFFVAALGVYYYEKDKGTGVFIASLGFLSIAASVVWIEFLIKLYSAKIILQSVLK